MARDGPDEKHKVKFDEHIHYGQLVVQLHMAGLFR